MPRFKQGRILASKALGVLASVTVIGSDMYTASDSNLRALSVDLTWTWNNATAGEGPIICGVAHGDYSDAEIEECLEQLTDMNRGNKVSSEQSNRLVRVVGTFTPDGTDETLNEGRPIKTKLNWYVTAGQTLKIWAYNNTSGSLTTGSALVVAGVINAQWAS